MGERYAASLRGYRSELISDAAPGRAAAGGAGASASRAEDDAQATSGALSVIRLALGEGEGELAWSQQGCVRLRLGAAALPRRPEQFVDRAAWPALRPNLREAPTGGFALTSPQLRSRVEVEAKPFRLRLLDRHGDTLLSLGDLRWEQGATQLAIDLGPGDAVYGLADAGAKGNLRGTRVETGGTRGAGSTPRFSTPFVWILRGEPHRGNACGLLVDGFAPCRFDIGSERPDILELHASAGLDLLLLPGPTPADVLTQLADRVGHCPLPPRWALGPQLVCGPKEARAVSRHSPEIPPTGIHIRLGEKPRWSRREWPRAEEIAAQLSRRGIHAVAELPSTLSVDPMDPRYREGLAENAFALADDGAPFVGGSRQRRAVAPDLNRSDVQQWWTRHHRRLLTAGVDGLWTEAALDDWQAQGVPRFADPTQPDVRIAGDALPDLVGHQQVRAARWVVESERPEQRGFTLTSRGGVGAQRLAGALLPVGPASWSTLERVVPQLLGLSMSGLALCGAEIGGASGRCGPELYARWVQLGALQPLARTRLGAEPRGSGTARLQQIVRGAWGLRQRLLPYLEACVREACESGTPVWRSMAYAFPAEESVRDVDDQFLLGPSLLIAPVVTAGARWREVVLPPGTWFDGHDDAMYRGPRRVRIAAPLDRIPFFVRAGSVLPTWNEHRGARLEVFPGADSAFDWVEDDGLHLDAASRSVVPIHLFANVGGRLRLDLGSRSGKPQTPRTLQVRFRGCPCADEVQLDGEPLRETESVPGWLSKGGRLLVSLRDEGRGAGLEIAPAP